MSKKFLLLFVSLTLFLSFALPTFAQDANKLRGNNCLYEGDVVTMSCVAPLFANVIYWLIILSGTIAVFFIIFGGIKFLTSGGAQDNVQSAKKTITFAVIGLIVVLFSFMIVNIVADLTGVNCITKFGFSACKVCGGDVDGYCPNGQSCTYTSTVPPQYFCN